MPTKEFVEKHDISESDLSELAAIRPPIQSEAEPEIHPVQNHQHKGGAGRAPKTVTMAAYEVYSHVFGPQPAMVDLEGRGCRGGFSAGELIAFLYAKSFPQKEWRQRVDEAFKGMKNL